MIMVICKKRTTTQKQILYMFVSRQYELIFYFYKDKSFIVLFYLYLDYF